MEKKKLEHGSTVDLFFVPPLGIVKNNPRFTSEDIIGFGFVKAFLADKDNDVEYNCPVFLLFKQKNHNDISFQEFVDGEYEAKRIVADYDYEGGYVVLVYEFPEAYRSDYKKLVKGEYSKVSEEFKALFPQTFIVDGEKGPSYHKSVFEKLEVLRLKIEDRIGQKLPDNSELRGIMEEKDYTLDINIYIQNEQY